MAGEVGSVFVRVNANTAGFDRGMGRVTATLSSAGSAIGKFGLLAAAGVGLGLGVAIKAAANFEAALNEMEAVSGATAKQMDKVSNLAKALGKDLSLPGTSAKDAAEAMTQLAKGGLKVKDAMAAARGVLQLSAAAQIENAQAATIVADALNAFGLAGKDATRVADLLANAANKTTGEITDFADGLQMSSAVAHQLGVPIEDLITMLGEMANAGIKGSDAGTSLKQMLLSLAAPTQKSAALMEDLGLKVFDSQGKFRGMAPIIGDFNRVLDGMTQKQKAATLATIFGSDAVRAAGIIFGTSSKEFKKLREEMERQGAAAELAAAKMKGFNGALEGLKSAAETLMINIGEPLLDLATRAVNKISEFVGWLEKVNKIAGNKGIVVAVKFAFESAKGWFQELLFGRTPKMTIQARLENIDPQGTHFNTEGIVQKVQRALSKIDWGDVGGKILSKIEGVAEFAGKVAGKIASALVSHAAEIGGAIGKAVWAAIKGAFSGAGGEGAMNIGALIVGYLGLKQFKAAGGIAGLLKKALGIGGGAAAGAAGAGLGASLLGGAAGGGAAGFLTKFLGPVGGFAAAAMPWVKVFALAWGAGMLISPDWLKPGGKLDEKFSTAGKRTARLFSDNWNNFGGDQGSQIGDRVAAQVRKITTEAERVPQAIRQIAPAFSEVGSHVDMAIRHVAPTLADIRNTAVTVPASIRQIAPTFAEISSAANAAGVGVRTGMNNVSSAVTTGIGSAVAVINGAASRFSSAGNAAGQGATSGVRTGLAPLPSVVGSSVQAGERGVSSRTGAYRTGGTNLGRAVGTGLSSAAGAVTGAATRLANSAVAPVRGAVGQFSAAGASAGQGFAGGISSAVGSAISAAVSLVNQAAAAARSAAQAQSPSRVTMAIGSDMGQGLVIGFLTGGRELPSKMSDTVQKALEAAKAKVESFKSTMASAFSDLASSSLSAFDRVTSEHVTKTRALLNQMADDRQLSEISENVRTSQNALNDAIAQGLDPAQIAQLQKAYDDAQYAQTVYGLEQKAAAEESAYSNQRELDRRHFEERLTALQTALEKHPEKHEQITKKINKLYEKFLPEYKRSGKAIGGAIAEGIRDSYNELRNAAEGAAQIIANALKLSSPAKEGPLSDLDHWWDKFDETLLKGLEQEKIRAALEKMVTGIPHHVNFSKLLTQLAATGRFDVGAAEQKGPMILGQHPGHANGFDTPSVEVHVHGPGMTELVKQVTVVQQQNGRRNRTTLSGNGIRA